MSDGRSPQEFGNKLGRLPSESGASKSNISEDELLPDSTRPDQIHEECASQQRALVSHRRGKFQRQVAR